MKKEESVIEIEINIAGQSHFIDELSNLIQLKPTSFWQKGDLRHFSKHVRVCIIKIQFGIMVREEFLFHTLKKFLG